MTRAHKILRFGRFTLDPNKASLCSEASELPLRPKVFNVLLYLAHHPGRIVTKDELIEAVWPGIFVTDNSLVQCISDIRAALEDDSQAILKTVARRGYLFAAPVDEIEQAPIQPRSGTADARREDRASGNSDAGLVAGLPTAVGANFWQRSWAWLAAGATVVVAVWVSVHMWFARPAVDAEVAAPSGSAAVPEVTPNARRLPIAVLPFVTLGAPSSEDYFADGLTEDIISALRRFAELSVLSPNTVSPYKGKALRPEDIGRDLKVRYFVEGTVRRTPERVRIAVRLTDASLGTLLWADQYDAEPGGIFTIQDNITRHITGALAVGLTNVEQARAAAKPPSSLEAYDLVLRGRDLMSRLTRSANSNARTMFERAAELDPNYAAAYVGLGRVDLIAVALGWTPDPAGALQRAESFARKAISIDEFNPAAHVLLGRAYSRLGEYDRALEALRRAMALNPSDPDSYAGLGDSLLWAGDLEAAITALEMAVQLDPKLPGGDLFNLGTAYFLAGRGADAVRVFERTVARNDSTVFIHAMLAAVHADAGRKDESERAAAEVRRRNPFFDLTDFGSLLRNPAHRQKIVSALQKAGF
jgi:adenylate cyclase